MPAEETVDSLSPPNPEIQFWSSNLLSPKGSKNTSSWGQSSRAGPLPSCGHHGPKAGRAPCLFSQNSADASQAYAAVPGPRTPPTRLARSPSGPGVGAGAQGRPSRRRAPSQRLTIQQGEGKGTSEPSQGRLPSVEPGSGTAGQAVCAVSLRTGPL